MLYVVVHDLYEEERYFFPKNEKLVRQERMFHHMGPSAVFRKMHNENDTDYYLIPSSIEVEKLLSSQMDHFERVII